MTTQTQTEQHTTDRGVIGAAAVVDALPPALAIRVLRSMEPSSVKALLHVKSDPRLEDRALLLASIEAFEEHFLSSPDSPLSANGNDASGFVKRLATGYPAGDLKRTPFEFLERATPRTRVELLQDEHPRQIAIVLSALSPVAASETLSRLDSQTQFSVIKRMCELDEIRSDDLAQLRYQLLRRMKRLSVLQTTANHQLEFATKLISCCDPDEQSRLLAYFEQADADLADMIRRSLISFDDLFHLTKADLTKVLQAVDTSWWAPSLKNADTKQQHAIFQAMVPAAAKIIRQEIDQLGNVELSSESEARKGIVQVMVHLAEEGQIELGRHDQAEASIRRTSRAA